MTTASGAREVLSARKSVWEALTVLTPYCPVCDVSYVFSQGRGDGAGAAMGKGTQFVCVRGRLDGATPPDDAVRGEVVEWVVEQCVGTRLTSRQESWLTRIELADAGRGSTRVTVSVTHEHDRRNWLLHSLRRKAMRRMVEQIVEAELAKLPEHLSLMTEDRGRIRPVQLGPSSVEHEHDGWVVHLRGEVDAAALDRLELQRRLEELSVRVIDVRELTYLDATAFPPLQRWVKRSSRAGGRAVLRGDNPYVDDLLADMGLTSMFVRNP